MSWYCWHHSVQVKLDTTLLEIVSFVWSVCALSCLFVSPPSLSSPPFFYLSLLFRNIVVYQTRGPISGYIFLTLTTSGTWLAILLPETFIVSAVRPLVESRRSVSMIPTLQTVLTAELMSLENRKYMSPFQSWWVKRRLEVDKSIHMGDSIVGIHL